MSAEPLPKKILFLCRRDDRPTYDTAHSMARVMQDLHAGISYTPGELEDLVFAYDGRELRIFDANSGEDLQNYDGIFMLGWFKTKILEDAALAVAKYAAAKGIPVLNSEVTTTRSRTKLSQYVVAALHAVAMVPFVFSIDPRHMEAHATAHGIEYPFILKSAVASRGADNHMIKTPQELSLVLASGDEVPFVAQAFVPNNGDYRLLVMGGSVRVALHRLSQTDSHINNTSQGGLATEADLNTLDTAMLRDAVKIARLINREVTGVDMIIHRDSGKHYLLEANNMPQLSTGSMVEVKMRALDTFLQEWLEAAQRF